MELTHSKPFRERSRSERTAIGSILVVSLALVAFTERDIQARDASKLRGGKVLWRGVATNALGALAYWAWGRRGDTSG